MIKKKLSQQTSLWELLRKTTPPFEITNSLHCSNASLNDEMKTQETCRGAPSTVKIFSKSPQKIKACETNSSKPQRGNTKY